MYKKLPNKIKTLICFDEVIALSSIEENAPRKIIESSIQIAESRIKSEICSDLYFDFRSKKNVEVTSINLSYIQTLLPGATIAVGDIVNAIEFVNDSWYVEFWNEHLWKILSEMVVYCATPNNYSRFTSQGEMIENPQVITNEGQGSNSVDLATIKWKLDRVYMDRIAPLLATANEYLFKNRNHFSNVNCKNWNFNMTPDGVATMRKSAWVSGIYDKKTSNKCYTCRDRDGF